MTVIDEQRLEFEPAASSRWRTDWLHGPRHDLALALLWVPFALAGWAVADDSEALRWLVGATLLFSFAHQPLTLWLVYADPAQRGVHRSLVTWTPLVLVAAIAVGISIRPELVALMAGFWNVAHTLRQRYGLCKLYGRMGGIDCGADNRLLWSWLAAAASIAFARTDLGATARAVGLGRRNTQAIDVVGSAQDVIVVLLPFLLAGTAVITGRWAVHELARPTHSASRLIYLASTASLFVVLAIDPVAGFIGYVGAHAAEYLLVVRWRVDRTRAKPVSGGVAWMARRVGGGGTLALYAVVVTTLLVAMHLVRLGAVLPVIVLTLGGLHLVYDGVIWKSPRPAVADSG
jgi:hypothetical protein